MGTFSPPSGSQLTSTTSPIVYTADDDVVAISVSFGSQRTEERVYRDGQFLAGYRRSSKSGLVYTLRRDDPWPMPPQVFVDESASGMADGVAPVKDQTADWISTNGDEGTIIRNAGHAYLLDDGTEGYQEGGTTLVIATAAGAVIEPAGAPIASADVATPSMSSRYKVRQGASVLCVFLGSYWHVTGSYELETIALHAVTRTPVHR